VIFDTDWKDKGACKKEDLSLFFPDITTSNGRKEEKLAVKICGQCSVKSACREYALTYEDFGVWGGLTERQRRQERRLTGMRVDTARYMVANFLGSVRKKK
jgi:WhiB family redox-sensing transcriptional regulator